MILRRNAHTTRGGLGIGLLCAIVLLPHVLHAAPATPDKVDQAIKKGVEFLYSEQKNGNWEERTKRDPTTRASTTWGGQWGGRSAIATYALLAAGQSDQDPRLAQAIAFLRRADLVGTYAISLRAQVWNHLPDTPENKQAVERDARLLIDLAKTAGDAKGFYSYLNAADTSTSYDHSNSQYGVLGAWACAETLDDFPVAYWPVVDRAWRADQLPSGAWSYYKVPRDKYPESITMTCAGVATLFITGDLANRGKPAQTEGNIRDRNIDAGMKWIAEHFNDIFGANVSRYYGLYGVERVGVASGHKYFKTINWYQTGADYIVARQKADGSWGSIQDTSFAILFLARGRAPITMNKLEYELDGKEANWNQRPRDAANLTRYIGKQTERDLNWQIVNLKAPVEELHDAPILYIAGDDELKLDDEQKQRLRQFAEQGGLILGQADASSQRFAKSFRALGSELFPAYEFRTLGDSHPIYTGQQFSASKWKRKLNVLGLSNGARELMLLLPDDPAKYWQPMDVRHSEEFQLGANIFLYAIDKKDLRRKGETYLVTPDPKAKPTRTITVARLQYDGNWDPEPGGWKRMTPIMLNAHKITLKTEPVKLGAGALKGKRIAHMTGTTQFKLEDESRKEIKAFIDAGGTLIIDSAGGNGAFSQSVETEMDAIFAADAKSLAEPLPADSPIYTAAGKAPEIAWRTHARSIVGTLKGPRVRGMKVTDRIAVIYSPEDLSVGLVGQPVDGINGYEPKTASALMTSLLLYADGGGKKK